MAEQTIRISRIKDQTVIALQEEGYYLKAELTSKNWNFQILDNRYPRGPLCTSIISVDSPQKLLTSPYADKIRKAYKKMYFEDYRDYLDKTIDLIQLYAKDFETDELEPEYTPKGQESKADRLINLALKAEIILFRDQFGEQYAQIPIKSDASGAGEATALLNTPTLLHTHLGMSDTPRGYLEKNSSTSSTAPPLCERCGAFLNNGVCEKCGWALPTKQIWSVNGEKFKQWLSGLMWTTDKEAAKSDHLNSAITVLCAMANEKTVIELHNRVAPDEDGGILLDMTNERWEALHITKDGWEIIPQPVTFRRYPHQLPLCYPSQAPDLSKLFKYINIGCLGDEERHVNEQLLFIVALITSVIPGIPHVGTILHGGAGKAKTLTQVIPRYLIDPSSIIYNALPSKNKLTSLIQVLDQHYYPIFDNLGDLDDDISDVFCRAITGAAFQLRKLFTNDEAYLRAYKRVVNMNGINIPGEKPDLLDRMLVFETLYIPMNKRRSETEIYAEFHQDAPDILAGILDVLVKAIKIFPTIKLERLPRMADFALWGCAVSEALGIPHSKFINAYYQNMLNVKGDVVKSRITGQILIESLSATLTEKRPSFSILVSKLHYQIMSKAKEYNMDTKNIPPDPTRLSRELNTISENLPSLGYVMNKKNTKQGTELTFSRIKNTTLDSTFEDKADSYKNVWHVSELSELLKPKDNSGSNEQQTPQNTPDPVEIQDSTQKQFDTIFGFIFDNGSVQDRYVSQELKIELPELRKLLAILVKDELIELIPPDKYRVKETGA